ncbi:protein Wnt-2 isoform X2 [Toxorhynchites rutilus septentrionalis]|uniref:protein Wnt-2 isoform X2 n=1 Tax=Toxorhynchites rutilus septentrionalis TaxID=329112 RepID=UPI00247B08D7|nr:protein Wnt-2 isoform X2 [Toxorhynchites rutilus septentrionalis]
MSTVSWIVLVILTFAKVRVADCFTSTVLCSKIPDLSPYQKQLCIEMPDAVVSLSAGQLFGARECQTQFKGHRWNCTQIWNKDTFGHIMSIGSREAAFTYGITSAGAVHAITAACAKGNISMCGCDARQRLQFTTESESWKWGGCSADIGFGMRFTKKFLDAREVESDDRSLMNLHNNRVGRKIVKLLLRTECKCHGVSGSCAMKTCWKSLPSFHTIGDVMMKKYRKARMVQAIRAVGKSNGQLQLIVKRAEKIQPNSANSQKPKRMELVYLQPSPNYCERDVASGILGTSGRQCNRSSNTMDKCDLLCCGRGYNTHQNVRTWQCNCKFKWCCTVSCDVCTERTEEYTCK